MILLSQLCHLHLLLILFTLNISVTAISTVDSIFLKLPQEPDLHNFIVGADSLGLTKLLQTIQEKKSEIPCEALLVYSSQIIGLIRLNIEKKSVLLQQLKIIKQTAVERIQRLKLEQQQLMSQRQSLNLQQNRQKILILSAELQDFYDKYNQIKSSEQLFKGEIVGYQKNIQLLEQENQANRQSILKRKLDIQGYQGEIQKLERLLTEVQRKKENSQAKVSEQELAIQQNDKIIRVTRQKIAGIESYISQTNLKADELRSKYKILEVSVQRLRKNIYEAEQTDNLLVEKIEEIEKKLAELENRVISKAIQNKQFQIKTISDKLPKFEIQNAGLIQLCYGKDSIEILKTGQVLVYIVKGTRLPQLLGSLYGASVASQIGIRKDIEFSVVDIFGLSWKNQYGDPFFVYQQEGLSDSILVPGDFSCLSPSLVKSGYATITKIEGNIISIIDSKNVSQNLIVGSCSRIEAANYLPQVGNKIFYTGIFEKGLPIKLYAATCF